MTVPFVHRHVTREEVMANDPDPQSVLVDQRSAMEPWIARVRACLSDARWEHVERVTELARRIAVANRFGEDEIHATTMAALLHDAARDLSAPETFALVPPTTSTEREHPLTLHGRAGRILAERWGIDDPRVLGAIEGHVFGVDPADRVGMAVYVADVSEPGRGVNDDVRHLAMVDLGAAYRAAVQTKVAYLRSRGKPVHPRTLEVHDALVAGPS